jgi:predicted aconitase with swiveling domain
MTTKKTFKGGPVLAGEVEGKAAASKIGFNTCAAWDSVVTGGDSAVCEDTQNPDLLGKDLAGAILCIPQTVGSSSASCMFMSVAQKGIAPAAMLFARHVDSLAATGLIMADNWLQERIIAVDLLGDDFPDAAMQPNASVKVSEDGTVEVSY